MEKKTRTASVGQILDLAATVQQGIPRELSASLVQKHLEHKGAIHRWLAFGLTSEPSLLEALLEGRLKLTVGRFLLEVEQRLEAAGWQIVEIPEGVMLASLEASGKSLRYLLDWHKRRSVEVIPTRARQVAWYPSAPLIPGSIDKTFEEQARLIADFSDKVQMEYGKGAMAEFPTTEEAGCLFFRYQEMLPESAQFSLPKWTRTKNERWGSSCRLIVRFSRSVLEISEAFTDISSVGIGVLKLIVPRSRP